MEAVDLDYQPKPSMPAGDPNVWLLGMEVNKAKELMLLGGFSIRVVKRQGCWSFDCRLGPDRLFRWNVEVDEIEVITDVLGRG